MLVERVVCSGNDNAYLRVISQPDSVKPTVTYTKIIRRFSVPVIVALALAAFAPIRTYGQQQSGQKLPQLYVILDGAGFIPFNQSYRINYQSRLAGMPFEWSLALGFPLNDVYSSSIEARYRHRTAVLLSDVSISQLEFTPGIRAYLDRQHGNDVRLYGSAGVLLSISTVTGTLQATHDGSSPVPMSVSKDYYNIGLALGLGIEVPLSRASALYGGFRIGVYLADPVSTGGLGDAGGMSLGVGYKYAIY